IAQIFVGAPVLGKLDGRTKQLPIILFELPLEPFEQGESVGGRAGEPADDLALADAADLLRVRLDHRIAEADLSVARDDGFPALLHPDDGCSVPTVQIRLQSRR